MGHGIEDFDPPPSKKNESLRRLEEISKEKEKAQAETKELRKLLDELGRGIEPPFIPTQDEIADAKRRIQYSNEHLHLAIAGFAGTGKSSLINAFRRLRNREPGAAATGTSETTVEIGRYPDPDPNMPFKRFVWYDIPGAGTQTIDDWQYAKKQSLYVFDVVILVVDNRFLKSDIVLLRHCEGFKVPTFIVRSKADQHIRNALDEESYRNQAEAASAFIDRTRKKCAEELQKAGLPDKRCYVVSAQGVRYVQKYIKRDRNERRPDIGLIDEQALVTDVLTMAHAQRYGSGEALGQLQELGEDEQRRRLGVPQQNHGSPAAPVEGGPAGGA